jgi:hypothetical protein
MKPHYILTIAMLAGVALGAIGVQALHAQTKPPVYYVAEVDVTDLDGYLKEYAQRLLHLQGLRRTDACCGPGDHSDRGRAAETPSCYREVGEPGTASDLAQFGTVQGRPEDR